MSELVKNISNSQWYNNQTVVANNAVHVVAKYGLNNPDGKGATFSFSLPINDEDLRSTDVNLLQGS